MAGEKRIKKRILDFFTKDVKNFSQKLNKLKSDLETAGFSSTMANKKFQALANEVIKKAEKLEKQVDYKLLKKIKSTFRMLLIDGPVYKSSFVKRAYDKPRGYSGDYQMIELFYNNQPTSKGIGFYGDKYILNDDYVRAVRNRKDSMSQILSKFVKSTKLSSINILNIGCGSCREIRELFGSDLKISKKMVFTFIDQDKGALNFSQKTFKQMSDQIPGNVTFRFVKENVLNLLNNKYKKKFAGQNMIYSIGLADYLPDAFLGRLIRFCFDLLEPKGTLIIAHKNIKKYKAIAPDWFCGWNFFPRNKRNLKEIINTYVSSNNYDIRFADRKLKHIFFVSIKKL